MVEVSFEEGNTIVEVSVRQLKDGTGLTVMFRGRGDHEYVKLTFAARTPEGLEIFARKLYAVASDHCQAARYAAMGYPEWPEMAKLVR